MGKILLASTSEEDNVLLRRKLEPLNRDVGHINFVTMRPQAVLMAVQDGFDLIILNIVEFTPDYQAMLIALRKYGYNGSVIVVAKASTSSVVREINEVEGAVYLEKPFEAKDLLGLVTKLLRAQNVAQRIYRRYYTKQLAEIEFVETPRKATTTLFNLSKGGAYIELANSEKLKIGDQLKLHVPLQLMRRAYEMPAKVVWLKPTAGNSVGVGLEFIGPGGVNKTVLGQAK